MTNEDLKELANMESELREVLDEDNTIEETKDDDENDNPVLDSIMGERVLPEYTITNIEDKVSGNDIRYIEKNLPFIFGNIIKAVARYVNKEMDRAQLYVVFERIKMDTREVNDNYDATHEGTRYPRAAVGACIEELKTIFNKYNAVIEKSDNHIMEIKVTDTLEETQSDNLGEGDTQYELSEDLIKELGKLDSEFDRIHAKVKNNRPDSVRFLLMAITKYLDGLMTKEVLFEEVFDTITVTDKFGSYRDDPDLYRFAMDLKYIINRKTIAMSKPLTDNLNTIMLYIVPEVEKGIDGYFGWEKKDETPSEGELKVEVEEVEDDVMDASEDTEAQDDTNSGNACRGYNMSKSEMTVRVPLPIFDNLTEEVPKVIIKTHHLGSYNNDDNNLSKVDDQFYNILYRNGAQDLDKYKVTVDDVEFRKITLFAGYYRLDDVIANVKDKLITKFGNRETNDKGRVFVIPQDRLKEDTNIHQDFDRIKHYNSFITEIANDNLVASNEDNLICRTLIDNLNDERELAHTYSRQYLNSVFMLDKYIRHFAIKGDILVYELPELCLLEDDLIKINYRLWKLYKLGINLVIFTSSKTLVNLIADYIIVRNDGETITNGNIYGIKDFSGKDIELIQNYSPLRRFIKERLQPRELK